MLPYRLTLSAEEDLKEVVKYTIRNWGKQQAENYAKLLEAALHKIASGKAISRTFSETYPEVHVTKCEHHYIFYLFREDNVPVILAVLHERMDFISRLKERLT